MRPVPMEPMVVMSMGHTYVSHAPQDASYAQSLWGKPHALSARASLLLIFTSLEHPVSRIVPMPHTGVLSAPSQYAWHATPPVRLVTGRGNRPA